MLFKTFISTLFATAALAAPLVSETNELSERAEVWTTKSLKRRCNAADTSCEWRFLIDTHKSSGGSPYHCVYTVTGTSASKTNGSPKTCEVFRIQTGYNSAGFTVLTAVHPPTNRIIYAGFDDATLAGGKTAPDHDWNVEQVPSTKSLSVQMMEDVEVI